MKFALRRLRLPLAILLLVLLSLAACSPITLHAWWSASTSRAQGFVSSQLPLGEGGQLAFREGGQGDVVLLIHGFGGNGLLHWRMVMGDLVTDHRVLAPDLLGFGDSHSPRPPSLDAQADALEALLRTRRIERVSVVGISYGGFLALELARRLPQQVSRAVIINSPGPVYHDQDLHSLLRRAGVQSATQLFVPQSASDMRRLIGMTRSQPVEVSDWLLNDMLARYYAGRQAGLTALMDELLQHTESYRARMQGIHPPSVVVWGEADAVFPLPLGQALAAALGAPLIQVAHGGHSLTADRPALAVQAVRQALNVPLQAGQVIRLGEDLPALK